MYMINVKQISPFSKLKKNLKSILIADYNNIIDSSVVYCTSLLICKLAGSVISSLSIK